MEKRDGLDDFVGGYYKKSANSANRSKWQFHLLDCFGIYYEFRFISTMVFAKFLSKLFSIKPFFLIFHYVYEFVAYFLFLKNKSQLKWKKRICLQKLVLFAKDLSIGEKNGD